MATNTNFFRELKYLMRDDVGQAQGIIEEIKNIGQGCTATERADVIKIDKAVRKFIRKYDGCVYDQCAPGQTPPVTRVPDAMKKDIKDIQFQLVAAMSKCGVSSLAIVPLGMLNLEFAKELERLGIPVEERESQGQPDQDPPPQTQSNQVGQPVPQPQMPPQPQRQSVTPQAGQNNPQNTQAARSRYDVQLGRNQGHGTNPYSDVTQFARNATYGAMPFGMGAFF